MHFETIPNEKKARLVFGLDWRAYATKGAAGERRRYADELYATHYVEIKGKEETVAGFCAPEPAERKGLKLYSAAARVAGLDRVRSKPAVLVLVQDGQRVHVILIVRGAVRVDQTVALNALEDRRDALEDECEKDRVRLVTIGHGADLRDLDEPFTPAELLRGRSTGLIRKLPVKVPKIVPLAVIAVALVYVGSEALSYIDPLPPPPAPPPTYMQDYQAAVARTFNGAVPLASALAPALIDTFAKQETNVAGWQFRNASCGATGFCSITFKREGGTYKEFDARAPAEMRPVVFDPNGLLLQVKGPAVPHEQKLSLAGEKQWPTAQSLIKQLQTDPQRLSTKPDQLMSHGYVVTLRPPQRLLARQPNPGEISGQLLQAGDWTIEGYMWQSRLLEKLPENMALDSLDLDLKDDGSGAHFTAKGKYYVLQ
ncbi:hypothetical protein EVC45_39520 [Paraburkholderia sp. UYCP14C]|uniref:hypothetical protein n=1 Tax=Paraburkholderia sp. UYCP14C TaxID=2511130 RepID=UPI0010221F76|nr:hypothetical protein [Paraburkholderia sp. UYCP14C]RZF24311.1 hypothetical protein EVC45_39520 [Paraburkholderia sp. UYCP14C]